VSPTDPTRELATARPVAVTLQWSKRWDQRRLAPYLFIAPFFVTFLVFWVGPIVTSVGISLTDWNGIQLPRLVGLANYRKLFASSDFYTAVRNTLVAAIVYDALMVVLAIGVAMLLDWRHLPFRRFFRAAYFAPVTMSLAVVALVFQLIYAKEGGLLNQLIETAGLPYKVDWLGDTRLALWSIVALRIWRATGYYAIIVLAGLQNIPKELYEVAAVDGATAWQRFRTITLPLLKPVTAFVVITSSIWALQLFDEPWILTKGGPINATLTMVIYLYQHSFQYGELGFGASIAYVLTMIIAIFSFLQLKLFAAESYR
jgi:lactose/L-arabinose transport system permease protein